MASFGKVVDGIGVYTIGDGSKRYRVVYKVGRNLRSKGGFKTKGAAQHWQRHTLVNIDNDTHVDVRKGKTTFGTYATERLDRMSVRPSTGALYRYQHRIHIEPTFGDMEFRRMDTEAACASGTPSCCAPTGSGPSER